MFVEVILASHVSTRKILFLVVANVSISTHIHTFIFKHSNTPILIALRINNLIFPLNACAQSLNRHTSPPKTNANAHTLTSHKMPPPSLQSALPSHHHTTHTGTYNASPG